MPYDYSVLGVNLGVKLGRILVGTNRYTSFDKSKTIYRRILSIPEGLNAIRYTKT